MDFDAMNLYTNSKNTALNYVISYKGEDGEWYDIVDNSSNLTTKSAYKNSFKGGILTDEIRVQFLNEGDVSLCEVEIFKQIQTTVLKKHATMLENLANAMKFGLYAGEYDYDAYLAFKAKANEVRMNAHLYNSNEIDDVASELTKSFIALKLTYVSIQRGKLLESLIDAKTLLSQGNIANAQALADAIDTSEAVYDTYKVTQQEIDDAVIVLKNAMELTNIPAKVMNVVAESVDYKTIKLTWDASVNAEDYKVERLDTATNEWMELGQTNETSYTHEKVKTGKEYTYRVTAVNEHATSQAVEAKATTSLQGEVELTIAPNGTNQFDLSWTAVEGATRYIVYRKASDSEWKKILTLGKDARSYTSKALKANTYSYMVKAARYDSVDRVMTNGSNVVDGIVEANTMKPTNVKVEQVSDSIILSWDKVVGMTYYEIYRSKDGGAYRNIKRTTSTTITSSSLIVGSTYTYKIRAFALVNGEKVYSLEVETNQITIE